MKKKLSKDLTLYTTNFFPYKTKYNSSKKYEAVIGIGGNLGDTKKIFHKLFLCLQKDSRFQIVATSPLLKNPPFGFLEQNYFLNGIISLKTDQSINEFFKSMCEYENRFKRERSFKNAPRTLDIDIIFFANKKVNTKKLTIPHKNWSKRVSVVIPLSRIHR